MTPLEIQPRVPSEYRRGDMRDDRTYVAEASDLLTHMAAALGLTDLAGLDVLDIGCGVKFTQAICTLDLPIGSYTGVDVYRDMIDHLSATVDDDRFRFATFDVHNEMYNPDAAPMTGASDLGVGDANYDLICGFSLFTHLAPDDFEAMLRVMRRYVRPDGHVYFSAFLNELTEAGHGLIDAWAGHLPEGTLEQTAAERGMQEAPDFVDFTPSQPLLHAVYSRPHALDLIERAGWEVVHIADPLPDIQHQFTCRPA